MAEIKLVVGVEGAPNARQNLNSIKSCVEDMGSSFSRLTDLAGKAFALFAGAGAIGGFAKSVLDAGIVMERLNAQLKVTTGSAHLAGMELSFIRGEAQRLGAEYTGLASQYAKLLFTTKGTSLEGSGAREMFTGFTEGFSAMKLSAEQMQGVWSQITQGMSKGKLELEDLKIIAENGIPVFNLLASAMGKSKPEIMQMISGGQLLSNEVYPKLAAAMHSTFGASAVESADGAQGAINRFNNALTESKQKLAAEWLPTFTKSLSLVTGNLDTMKATALGAAAAITGIGLSRNVLPAASAAVPYLKNMMDNSSGAVALGGATANKMMSAEILEQAKAQELVKAQTLATAMAQEKNLLALHSSGVLVQRLGVDAAQRASGLTMQEQAYRGLAVAARTTATAEAEHTAAVRAVSIATTGYSAAQAAATLTSRALTVASTALKGVLSFFGGWVGLIITGLAAAATAWSVYSGKQDEARKSGMSVLETMRDQVKALEEKKRLENFKGPAEKAYSDSEAKQLAYLKKQVAETADKAESSVYQSDTTAHEKALADLDEFYKLKKTLVESKAAEDKVAADRRLKEQADQEKMAAEKLADDRRKLEQVKAKVEVDGLKERGQLRLDQLKSDYDQGLVATDAYYRETLKLAQEAMNAEIKVLNARKSYIQKDLAAELKKTGGKDSEKSITMQGDLIGINREADSLRNGLKGETIKLIEEEKKKTAELKQTTLELKAAELERAEEFVKASEVRRQAYESSAEFLRLEKDAMAGNAEAMELYYAKGRQWSDDKKQNQQKEKDSLFEHEKALKGINEELARLNGTYIEETAMQKFLREEKEKLEPLEKRLLIAKINGGTKAVQWLEAEIDATRLLTAAKQQQLAQDERNAAFKQSLIDATDVLSGKVIGYDNGKPIYANAGGSFVNGVAAGSDKGIGLYSSPGAVQNSNKTDAFGNQPGSPYYIGDGYSTGATFLGKFATGSSCIPSDGYAYLHEGEAVIPANINKVLGEVYQAKGDGSWWTDASKFGMGYQQLTIGSDGLFQDTPGYQRVVGTSDEYLKNLYENGTERAEYIRNSDGSWSYRSTPTTPPTWERFQRTNEALGVNWELDFERRLQETIDYNAPRPSAPASSGSYYNSSGGAGNQTFNLNFGDIIVQGGSTGTETAREIARAIYPELQKLSGRRLAA